MWQIIQKRKYTYVFSIVVTLASIAAISAWGLKLGIDFRGGTLMEVRFSETRPDTATLTEALSGLSLQSLSLQSSEERGLILRYLASDESKNEEVLNTLQSFDGSLELLRTDFIGASVSREITQGAIYGVILALIGVALYIAWAFKGVSGTVTSWEYGLGAVLALAHDILVTVGIFAALGHFLDVEIGVPFVAALLTILGYSVNDTIVIYDRVRENLLRSVKHEDFETTVNRSLNETLGRSFNTSFTVMVTLIAIVLFGGASIQYFALAILIGVAFGTYSSIYVASALLVTRYQMKTKNR